MDKIITQIDEWKFLEHMPLELAGFCLDRQTAECGSQYTIFTYSRPLDRRMVTVLYDAATKDFLARVTVGLTEFYDISFITTTLAALEEALATRLEKTLICLSEDRYESIFSAKKIMEWSYIDQLPLEHAGFGLFINPKQPVKTINGSYIVIDYSDFASASSLIVYYNVYRDEFFGELRLQQKPQMIGLFDARELDQLAIKLEESLCSVLDSLRGEIA